MLTELLFEQDFRYFRIFVSDPKLGTCSLTYTVYHMISAVCHNRYIKLYKTSFMKKQAPKNKLQCKNQTYVSENSVDEVQQQGQLESLTVIVICFGLISLLSFESIGHYYFNKRSYCLNRTYTILFYQKPAYFMSHLSI